MFLTGLLNIGDFLAEEQHNAKGSQERKYVTDAFYAINVISQNRVILEMTMTWFREVAEMLRPLTDEGKLENVITYYWDENYIAVAEQLEELQEDKEIPKDIHCTDVAKGMVSVVSFYLVRGKFPRFYAHVAEEPLHVD